MEGYTFQPEIELEFPDVENCQILDYGCGNTPVETLENMIDNNKYIFGTSFSSVSGLELYDSKETYLNLNGFRSNKIG